MTDDRKPLPAEAEMVLVPRAATENMCFAADGLTDFILGDGGDAAARRKEFALAWSLMVERALTAAPKATETPGLREAAAPFVKHYADWMIEWPDDQEVSVYPRHTYGQIRALRAALSATPHSLPNMPGLRDEASIEAAYEEYRLRPVSGHADGFSPVVPALKHAFFAGAEAASTAPSPLSTPKPVAIPDYGEERNDYISSEKAREMFGDEDDDEPLSDRIRVCDGEWVRIPGGYYFDKSAGPLHPEVTSHDDAGRDEVVAWRWRYVHLDNGSSAWVPCRIKEHAPTSSLGSQVEVDALVPASALSAERAAHEQTRQERGGLLNWKASTSNDLVSMGLARDAAEAEVARLRKVLDQCATIAETQPLFPDTTLGARQEWVKREIAASIRALARPASARQQREEAEERRVEIARASTIPGMVTHQWHSAFFAEAIRDQTPRRKKA